MTGIVATYEPDGTVSEQECSTLLDTLDYRGHDGRDVEVRGSTALGHQHFWTTPEAVGERQPVSVDGVTVAFDGRVDGRDRLLSALPESGRPNDEPPSDATLVAAAYREWGPATFERLIGVYAVVIRDERREQLVCACDPGGVRDLYYSTAGGRVVVGSDPRTVLRAPEVPDDVDDGIVGESLLGEYGSRTRTVYEAVRAVEPGTYVTLSGGDPTVTRFWDPASVERLSITDPAALADELADRLRDAIAARLRTGGPPRVLLSGGLDSTTMTAIAADRVPGGDELRAVSMQFEDPERADAPECHRAERRRVEAFVEEYDLPLEYYPLDEAATPLSVDAYADPRIEWPVLIGIEAPKREVYARIADADCRVVLTGEFGNLFDGMRFSYHDLLREGKLRRAVSEMLADPFPIRHLLTWYVLAPAFPGLGEWLLERGTDGSATIPDWLTDEFADRVNLRERLGDGDEGVSFDRVSMQQTYDAVYRTDQLQYYRRDRRRALSAGVDPRHPFADRRVLEFLYALPTGARSRAGEKKFFFRRLAEDLLPSVVLDQSEPFRFDPVIHRGLRRNAETLASLVIDGELVDRGVVDPGEIERIYSAYLDGDDRKNVILWELAATELWLRDFRSS